MSNDEMIEEIIRQKEQASIALQADRTALLIVDVQRFFTRPDADFAQLLQTFAPGALDGYFQRVNSSVLPNIRELQNCFRSLAHPVIQCVFGSCTQDGQDLPRWLKDFDALSQQILGRRSNPVINGESWQIDEAVAPLPGELVINKTTSGALSSTAPPDAAQHAHHVTRGLWPDDGGVCRSYRPPNGRPRFSGCDRK